MKDRRAAIPIKERLRIDKLFRSKHAASIKKAKAKWRHNNTEKRKEDKRHWRLHNPEKNKKKNHQYAQRKALSTKQCQLIGALDPEKIELLTQRLKALES